MKKTVQMFKMSKPSGTVAELISQLKINHHDNFKQDEQSKAFYAQNDRQGMNRTNRYNKNNRQDRKPMEERTCNYCNLPGHLWRNCDKLKADNENKDQDDSQDESTPENSISY
jgi:hypothetical protein